MLPPSKTSSSLCACCPSITGGMLSSHMGGQGMLSNPVILVSAWNLKTVTSVLYHTGCDVFPLPSCPSPSAPSTDTEGNVQNKSKMRRPSKDMSVSERTSLECTALALSSTLALAISVAWGNLSSLSLSFLTRSLNGWGRYRVALRSFLGGASCYLILKKLSPLPLLEARNWL